VEVEYYRKLIMETLYTGFMKSPPNRINNEDLDTVFVNVDNATNFRISRQELTQEGLIHGKSTNRGNPPYLQIAGDGIVYYEKHYIIPSINREYTLLASRFITFLREIGNGKYDIKRFANKDDERKPTRIPLDYVNQILKTDYKYEMDNLKWLQLYFTSDFVNKHIMEVNGIGFGKDHIALYNPDSYCLSSDGYNFLNEVFLNEKFQTINNKDGRERVTQLYDDLTTLIPKKRWVDVAINMGAIIEYCLDNYIEAKNLSEFYNKNGNIYEKLFRKVGIILQNPNSSSDTICNAQYRATWKRIQNVLRDWRNYIHISKLVREQSPLDEQSIQNFYSDFESVLNILLNL